MRQGELDQALKSYEKAKDLDPQDPKIYNYIGYAQILLGVSDQAVTNLQISIQKDPSYALAHYNLAIALWELGRKREAVRELDQAEKLDPELGKDARADPHTGPILGSHENGIYQDLKKGLYHYSFTLRVGPPAGFDPGKAFRDVSVIGGAVYESFEINDDRNPGLVWVTDGLWVLGLAGYYLEDSDMDTIHRMGLGMAAGAMVINLFYPPISTVDGYLDGNNSKGDRGLIGCGVEAVAITAMALFNDRVVNSGPIYPETFRNGTGVKVAWNF